MPMLRAGPSTLRMAASRSVALRSASLAAAISRTCSRVTLPTGVRPAASGPLVTPAALRRMSGAGGELEGDHGADLLRHESDRFLSLELLDLEHVQLDRRLAAEDADQDLHLVT